MSASMNRRSFLGLSAAATMGSLLTACGGGGGSVGGATQDIAEVDTDSVKLPLAETATLKGLTSFPAGSESEPNNRTIFKRLEEKTNVHIDWKTIQSDQWADKITLEMSNVSTLPDFVFSAGFGDTDLLKYAGQGVIISLEEYIDKFMPNLQAVFEQAPEYRTMCEDEDGHIWALPWIEQLGYEKTAIQTIGDMPFINKGWLDFLKLDMPTNVDEFEQVLVAFKDHADELKKEFSIEGDIIPMACILNDGDQDPYILINGFGEGYGDPDRGKHIAVTDDGEVVCVAQSEGFKKGTEWLHKLYDQGLIDPEAFTQEWSTYVAKGKSGRYGVCFSWDVANIAQVSMDDLIAGKGWVPLPALEADTKNITPQTASFTSGFDRGRCVITAKAENPALVCSWLDQMYDPFQSPQNNWGTYGEDDDFDIFVLGKNDDGEDMLQHAPLGDASPVEVREAECVGGPLAILDSYYGVYVTTPDDAQYRLDWIKDIYTPDMNFKYCYPNVFMSSDDTKQVSNLMADLQKCINTFKSDSVMNGFTDKDWDKFQSDLEAYGIAEFLEIHQRYLTEFLDNQA
ncbi:MAG: extracellular solute-binding protein [Atopobiaceae bacterium]|nr:extracellular solute-binding protein [Atopobiaceae bacterium]